MLALALTNVPTIITVIIGILINNARHNQLRSQFSALEMRFASLEHTLDSWFTRLEAKIY